jgi:putative addiction module component (TIGR02574 family)
VQTLSELEQEAMKLPEEQRARLACRLLDSLPVVLSDDDEGVAEALRRDAELERDPTAGLSLEELRRALKRQEWG